MKAKNNAPTIPTRSEADRRLITEQGRIKLQNEIKEHQLNYPPLAESLAKAKAWEFESKDCYVPARGDSLVCKTGIGLDTVVSVAHGLDPFHVITPGDVEAMDLADLG